MYNVSINSCRLNIKRNVMLFVQAAVTFKMYMVLRYYSVNIYIYSPYCPYSDGFKIRSVITSSLPIGCHNTRLMLKSRNLWRNLNQETYVCIVLDIFIDFLKLVNISNRFFPCLVLAHVNATSVKFSYIVQPVPYNLHSMIIKIHLN